MCVSPQLAGGEEGAGNRAERSTAKEKRQLPKKEPKVADGQEEASTIQILAEGGGVVQKLVHHHHCGKAIGRFIYGNQRVLANFGKLTILLAHFFRAPFSFKSPLA